MMKPLREQVGSSDPVVARAAALVAATRPLDAGQIRRRPLPNEVTTHHGGLHLHLAFVVLALILASAVAGATTLPGAGWLRALGAWTHTQRPSAPPPVTPVARTPVAEPSAHPSPASADVPPVVAAATSSPPRPPITAAPVRAPSRSARPHADLEDESALVVEAVRALRRDHDSRRARELAEDALQRFPHGAQSEEAMAVAMEAASGDGDTAAARRWAARYLESFGAGRFADRARDVLAASPR